MPPSAIFNIPFLSLWLSSLLIPIIQAVPAPTPSNLVSCNAAWVKPLIRIVEDLPHSEGIEFCSSAVHKYASSTDIKTQFGPAITSYLPVYSTITVSQTTSTAATQIVTSFSTVTATSTVDSTAVSYSTFDSTIIDDFTALATSDEYSTAQILVTEYTTLYAASTDIVITDLTYLDTSTIQSYETVYSTVYETATAYSTQSTTASTFTSVVTTTAPAVTVPSLTISYVVEYDYSDVDTTTTLRGDLTTFDATVTSTIPSTKAFTVTTSSISTVATIATIATTGSGAKAKRSNINLAEILGIAESLVTEFCSCVATGPTSTSYATQTVAGSSTITLPTTILATTTHLMTQDTIISDLVISTVNLIVTTSVIVTNIIPTLVMDTASSTFTDTSTTTLTTIMPLMASDTVQTTIVTSTTVTDITTTVVQTTVITTTTLPFTNSLTSTSIEINIDYLTITATQIITPSPVTSGTTQVPYTITLPRPQTIIIDDQTTLSETSIATVVDAATKTITVPFQTVTATFTHDYAFPTPCYTGIPPVSTIPNLPNAQACAQQCANLSSNEGECQLFLVLGGSGDFACILFDEQLDGDSILCGSGLYGPWAAYMRSD